MYTLITFATQWGSKFGGINSFNTDFLSAFGIAYHAGARVICIVAKADAAEIEEARNSYVTLLQLPYSPQEKTFGEAHAHAGIDLLKQEGIVFGPEHTIWLGHDSRTGAAAIAAAKQVGGRSALIHHMSYAHYEAYAEDSSAAHRKNQEQQKLFGQADLILAVGPLLRDAAHDLVGGAKPVHMLVPGLADIETQATPRIFVAFLGGRLSGDAARVKQGYLSVAALAHAHKEACKINMPDALCQQPRLMLRGVDFASEKNGQLGEKPEDRLKAFAESYAERAITILALPYTHERKQLYTEISRASVVMMLSWHEGFGLAAWEAIAAGVPLILSKQSGVYKLLEEKHPGCEKGFIYPIDVRGTNTEPFFQQEDLEAAASALREIAHQPEKARQKAGTLRDLLLNVYTWASCAEDAAKIFSWSLQKGSLPPQAQKPIAPAKVVAKESEPEHNDLPIHMPVKHWRAGSGIADSHLLRAEEMLVPFDPARQPELDKLDAWLDDKEFPLAIRLLTGAGGLGKTRLSLQLCQQRIEAGWHCGFLDSELTAKLLASGWQTLQALKQPLLIVIDYAETRQEDLLTLLRAMLQSPAVQTVRLLLLARDGGEWWEMLPSNDKICGPLLSGYATSGPYQLPPLHDEVERRHQAYWQALQAFASALNVAAPEVTPELAGEHFGIPLYLQMAALLALHGERPESAQGLTRALLGHERRYWRGLLASNDLADPVRQAEQLLALTTLAGGFTTPKAARPYWEQAYGKTLAPAQFNLLFHELIPLYPGKQGLQAVRPDLLGEALVAQALLHPSAADLLDAVLGKDAGKGMRLHTLTVIARLSDHYPELHEVLAEALVRHFAHCAQEFILVATETPSTLPALAEAAFTRLPLNSRNQVAGFLEQKSHEESVQLASFYCLVKESRAEQARSKYQKNPQDVDAQHNYAVNLGNYANTLRRTGRTKESMKITQEVLGIFQRLAHNNLARFEPGYATSLGNYANYLGEVSRYDEALSHAKQALEIRARLAKANPDRFEQDYAAALNNYATCLSDVDRDDDALEHSKQALAIFERLAKKNPDLFEPDYAGALSNYASYLGNAGCYDEALAHSKQALEIRERQAKERPDRFEPNYAGALSNYANCLSDVCRDEEALEHIKQTLEIRARLAKKSPDRFEPGYAESLSNYAHFLSNVGRDDDALDHIKQALDIRERLAKKNPARFEPDYAGSLNNYAIQLTNVGRDDEALEYAKPALEIRERLAKKDPARFSEGQFSTAIHTQLLVWLVNASAMPELPPLPETIPTHRRPLLQLFDCFVGACCTTDATGRAEAFNQAALLWKDLSVADKTSAIDYWLCAAAWCAAHEPAAVADLDWQAEWHKFRSRRYGNIPAWMLKVARRLNFKWPE